MDKLRVRENKGDGVDWTFTVRENTGCGVDWPFTVRENKGDGVDWNLAPICAFFSSFLRTCRCDGCLPQVLLDRMQKGPRYSNDILLAIEEFLQLTQTHPRVIEAAIGAAFSQFLPLIYSLNSHVAAAAVAALELLLPLMESRIHLVAPQIVEALSNNMQNARTCDHSKTVFNQLLGMQRDRAGTLLAPLSSHITTVMKKNKKEAFAFITGKYAETLGFAYPKAPKSQAAAVQILQFVKSVMVWITNYGDLDSSSKPEIVAVDALIQQAIRSFGLDMVNKVCYDYRDTVKVFLSRREESGGRLQALPKASGLRLMKLVTRKSSLMAFRKKVKWAAMSNLSLSIFFAPCQLMGGGEGGKGSFCFLLDFVNGYCIVLRSL